jgi:hypothetical protein
LSPLIILLVTPFASIGVGVVAVIACLLFGEIVRAIRQGHRVSTVAARVFERRRKATWREWYYAFRREFFNGYAVLRIGWIEIPHDPNERLRSSRR